jgi:hypothetical protein
MNRRTLAILALLAAAPLAAEAQSFRCVGKDGKRYYGSTAPAAGCAARWGRARRRNADRSTGVPQGD